MNSVIRKLDNAAKLFSLDEKKNTNTFKLSVYLKDKVDAKILKSAVIKTLDKYPNFKVKMKSGMFWNYFKTNSNKIIDIRVIAATNKDLENMVNNGLFREDLYYRLNVIPINLPSLRERREDIPLLIDFMVKDYARKLNKDVQYIDENAVEVLKGYNWAGNIRELQNIIEYSVNMSSSNIITVDMLPSKVNKKISNPVIIDNEDVECLEGLERREIIKALNKYKNYKKDKELAAKALGISRATLYRKLDKYNIISK